jgi:hypothetical protein
MNRHLRTLFVWLARSRRVALTLIVTLAAAMAAHAAGAQVGRYRVGPPQRIPGEILVWAQPGNTPDAVRQTALNADSEVIRPLLKANVYLLKAKGANGNAATEAEVDRAIAALRASGRFRWVGPHRLRFPLDVPNDPRYNQQWHHPVMNMPAAWDIQKGQSNVVIAVIDTGFDVNHEDLRTRLLGARNFYDPNNPNDVSSTSDHGTHVAGLAAAATNNGIGIAGVAWENVGLFVAKAGDPFFPDAALIDSITYIRTQIAPGKKVVINMSLGGFAPSDIPDPNDPFNATVLEAAESGIVFTISAGNAFELGNPPINPANLASLHPNIICVAACGKQKEHASYSSARPYTTISAPGGNGSDDMISTLPGNTYGGSGWQGTSMAAPNAAGVVALCLSAGAPAGQIKDILTRTADPVGRSVPNDEYGYGVLDAQSAVQRAVSGISLESPANGSFVFGTVNVRLRVGSPGSFSSAELRIDNDPTVVASTSGPPYVLPWNSRTVDPNTGQPKYANGNRTLHVRVQSTFGVLNFTSRVRLDNPTAAISTPGLSSYVAKSTPVIGTSDGLRVPTYTLEYSLPESPNTFTPIVADQRQKITDGLLGTWDVSAVRDGTATLRLRVRNPDNYEVSATRLVTVDNSPPTTPANLRGTSSNRMVNLTWSASRDNNIVVGYNVYRSEQSLAGYEKLNSVPLPSPGYVDQNLTNGKTYFYKVSSVDGAGNESAPTDFLDLTPNRNGTMSGQVTALDGTFLQGATVTVLKDGNVVRATQTDSAGLYAFPSPPGFDPGSYTLKFETPGYVSQLIENVTVGLGQDAPNQNVVLQPQPQPSLGWSMLTIPYNFQAGTALTTVLAGVTADALRYWDARAGRYLRPTDPGFPNPAPGIGYWVFRSGGAPSIVGSGVPILPTRAVEIPIRRGWNLLGNPFQYPINWVLANLIVKNADPSSPGNGQQATLSAAVGLGWTLDFAWSGADGRGRTLIYDRSVIPGISDTIPPYGAFWFFSNVDGSLSIAPPSTLSRSASEMPGLWVAQINASANGQTSSVYFGLSNTPRQFRAAPAIEEGLRIVFAAGEQTGSSQGVAADLRSHGAATQTWDIVVEGQGDQPVTLTWPNSSRVPRGYTLTLVDKSSGQRVNLRTSSSYTLRSSRASHALQLVLTRDTSRRLFISDLRVTASRSNRPVISFTLSREGQTTVSIVRANGETVRTLTSRSVQSGTNSLVWDTRDDAGRSVAPGVYLAQVRAVSDGGEAARAVVAFVITR